MTIKLMIQFLVMSLILFYFLLFSFGGWLVYLSTICANLCWKKWSHYWDLNQNLFLPLKDFYPWTLVALSWLWQISPC